MHILTIFFFKEILFHSLPESKINWLDRLIKDAEECRYQITQSFCSSDFCFIIASIPSVLPRSILFFKIVASMLCRQRHWATHNDSFSLENPTASHHGTWDIKTIFGSAHSFAFRQVKFQMPSCYIVPKALKSIWGISQFSAISTEHYFIFLHRTVAAWAEIVQISPHCPIRVSGP